MLGVIRRELTVSRVAVGNLPRNSLSVSVSPTFELNRIWTGGPDNLVQGRRGTLKPFLGFLCERGTFSPAEKAKSGYHDF